MRYSNTSVLVTGAAGFIGSNLVYALLAEGARVYALDDLFTGDRTVIDRSGVKLEVGSVCDRELVEKMVSKVDIIFHLAARNIIASTKSPREDYETNIGGTLNLLLAMQRAGCDRLVYTSSASVYGNARYLPISEDDRIDLLTPYAVSKFAGEGYCMAFYESYHLPVAVLRLSNVYGRGQSPNNPYCGVVAKFMERIQSEKGEIEIHGDGLSTRDFTYVDDVIEALLLAGISPRAEGEVYNVATGVETSINQLAESIIKLYKPSALYSLFAPAHIDRRDIDNIRRRVLNVDKIRRHLGWIPKVTLAQGLQLTKESLCKETFWSPWPTHTQEITRRYSTPKPS